jgi:hypothetical protein
MKNPLTKNPPEKFKFEIGAFKQDLCDPPLSAEAIGRSSI